MTTRIKNPTLFNETKIIRSPFFYVGDKYKLMPQLKTLFPQNIDTYIEPFVGGGSSFLNTSANSYILNDVDSNIISLHNFFKNQQNYFHEIINKIFSLIQKYNLSCSLKNIIPSKELREEYKKTYFARFNQESYIKLRNDFNANKNDILRLYLLLIYGFNHMIRFNSKGDFNLPVGNVDFNENVFNALQNYIEFMRNNNIIFFNLDYIHFLNSIEIQQDDFLYFDPPYLISGSEYNKLWGELLEIQLYQTLQDLDSKGVRWGITNLLHHKGKINHFLQDFMKNYSTHYIKSNYISFNDNTIKKDSTEVYITNVKN
ncbi:DNA adenine methylase [Helicobacter monodelphidis]|uniref:Site-specific DNA-methyltransferase (adenine-specific) n=1 Tax=Helicobacter didelphidarum TaxID=2040648 RepID=A0A3D8IDA8_9HELI|nr:MULTISPECIES: Dam family site-specific DNA-(adenine-N6)-methyltransferase [Helicobacter]RAX58895.1 DNA adenine methylase [Helicobacter sp. 15-1451]RDU63203.1 DNA adenine methylase [Helicobacter didelphidarum]